MAAVPGTNRDAVWAEDLDGSPRNHVLDEGPDHPMQRCNFYSAPQCSHVEA